MLWSRLLPLLLLLVLPVVVALPGPALALLVARSSKLMPKPKPLLLLVVVEGADRKEAMAWARLLASSSSARQNMAKALLLVLPPPGAAGCALGDAAEVEAERLDAGRGLCVAAGEPAGFMPGCCGLEAVAGRTLFTGLCMLAAGRLQQEELR
jgi:hypothetical protein